MEGLDKPDGLVECPGPVLYVCEEAAGRVLALRGDSSWVVAEGLDSPEGLCAVPGGGLLVTEDVPGGRLLRLGPDGGMEVLASGLTAPEGVCVMPDGTVAVSWSNAQTGGIPFPLESGVLAVEPDGDVRDLTRLSMVYSLSDLACDNSGNIYVANESSGMLTWASVLVLRPGSDTPEVLCRGLFSCEGLSLSPGGGLPLLVVEEDRGHGNGRVVAASAEGDVVVLADSLSTVEDVVVLPDGSLAVSEDGTGRVLRIPGMDWRSIGRELYLKGEVRRQQTGAE
jgi:sugar lactone lactonase YvrE